MIVLVTGGRGFSDHNRLWAALDRIDDATPIDRLVVGDAQGADAIAYAWLTRWRERATGTGRTLARNKFVANWREHGNAAGPFRNSRMVAHVKTLVDAGEAAVVLACPGGAGTADCVRKARAAGLVVKTLDDVLDVALCSWCGVEHAGGPEYCP